MPWTEVASKPLRPRSHLFTLRLWLWPLGDGQTEWRGKVQHVTGGKAQYIRDWPARQGESGEMDCAVGLQSQVPDLFGNGSGLVVPSNRLLHELRFWPNADMDAATPFTLILLGQPDLQHRLQLKDFEVLDQRIQIRYPFQPFDLRESVGYVKHQLRVAGAESNPFPEGFVTVAHHFSHGVPRQLDRVCLSGLLIGSTDRKHVLDASDAKRAIQELGRPS